MLANFWIAFSDQAEIDQTETDSQGHQRYINRAWTGMADQNFHGFRQYVIGARTWTCRSLYFEVDDGDAAQELAVDFAFEHTPADVRIIGAWWAHTGEMILKSNGQPITPFHEWGRHFMPDIVSYDEDLNETGRERPDVDHDVIIGAGDLPRAGLERGPP